MKKSLTLICALLFCTTGIKSQSCATAMDLSTYTFGSPLSQSNSEEWYRFSAAYQDVFLDVLRTDTTFHWVDSVFFYGNSCGSLTLLGSYGRPLGWDSVGMIELRVQNLSISSTYYIKVKLSTTLAFNVSYALNISNASASPCNLVINGDFENIGPATPALLFQVMFPAVLACQ